MQYFIGFIFIAGGFLLIWKSRALLNFFGEISFAEEKLSTFGGTNVFYKLLGLALILFGLLMMGGDVELGLSKLFNPNPTLTPR